jgi:exopolysaccharide biosynthesis polyprenyl glycosylphosphotransferase
LRPDESYDALIVTFFSGLVASVASVFAIRGISKYPGAESVSSTLPMVSLMYGVLVSILLIGRIEYVRSVLIGNYLLCLMLLFLQQAVWADRRKLRIGIIEGGSAQAVPIDNLEWVPLTSPSAEAATVDAVTVDLRADLDDAWERRITQFALDGLPVYHIKHLHESMTGKVQLEHLAETSYGTLSPPISYIYVKRVVDFLIAGCSLLILSPLLLVIIVAVKIDSPGPAIFKQVRIGFRGRPFTVRKFRTMRVAVENADRRSAAMTKPGDARITRVGGFLRKTRIDEIPQLINVLRGEMSLIGPRPEAAVLSEWYEKEIPFYRYRHIVMPGVTGWAQVNQGHVTDVNDVHEKLHYDFYYIKHLSPWIDCLILIRTILVMFTGHGAR